MLSDEAYRAIKRKIATLELPPSSLINEQKLVQELGIGRTPVREALHRLALENLVTIVPRRGTFVSNVGITDLQELAEIRQELEGLAARLAVERMDADYLAEMESLSKNSEPSMRQANEEDWVEQDQRFHHLLYQAAGNRFLQSELEQLYTLSLRLWYLALDRLSDQAMQDAVALHAEIVEAFKAGDASRAEQTVQRDVAGFHRHVRAAL